MVPGYSFIISVLVQGASFNTPDMEVISGLIILVFLLLASALLSSSETAYFNLGPDHIEKLKSNKSRRAAAGLKLHETPEKLLSTILVANNTINVAIILLCAFLSFRMFDFSANPVLGFFIEAACITFILLLFGEIMPKVYATKNQIAVVLLMAYPLKMLGHLFRPVTALLISSTSFVSHKASSRGSDISMDDLSDALELASDNITGDEKILKGIMNFGNTNVSEIMCPRVDVTAIDMKLGFNKVKSVIIESGFSRIPVYSGSFDNVKGILFAKDVLPYTNNPDNFKWQSLMRPPHFVPETKRINDMLKEFQVMKNHMAVVIDEYGGSSGLITLEDVLEEIVGEITDESDEEEPLYRKIDEKTYVFMGKILLNDFFKIINVSDDHFEEVRGESETLAGLLLELTGEIPQKGKVITYKNFTFKIEAADKRRIKEISVEFVDYNGDKKQD